MNPYTMGYEDAINRGPKTAAGLRAVRALSQDDYREYLKGVQAGQREIFKPATENIHTEFIAEDND